MNRLLEILGRAVTQDLADIIWHWINQTKLYDQNLDPAKNDAIDEILDLIDDSKMQKIDGAYEKVTVYCFENPDCVYGHMATAAVYIRQNRIIESIEELNVVYKKQPGNTMALFSLGLCCERTDQIQKAIEFYQDCLKFKDYLLLPAQRLAAIYLAKGQIQNSIKQYELLVKHYPQDISILILLGYLYITDKRYISAIDTFNKAILIHPDNFSSTRFENIDRLICDKNYEQAIDNIDELLAENPQRPELLLKKADVYAMNGYTSLAIEFYEKALKISPDFLEASIKLGTQYLNKHQLSQAGITFNKALELNDNIVDAYIGLSIAQKKTGMLSDATNTLSLATAIQPNSLILFAETAKIQFITAITQNDTNYTIHDNYDPSQFINMIIDAHYEQISQDNHNPDLYYRIGLLLMLKGDFTKAERAFKSALIINPTNFTVKSKLAICRCEMNMYDKAIEHLSQSTLNNKTLWLHYKTALLYCNKIQFASNLLNLELKLRQNYTSSDTPENISIILQNLGILDKCSTRWENLMITANNAIDNAHKEKDEY